MRSSILVSTLLCALVFTGCTPDALVNKSKPIENGEWALNDKATFEAEVKNPTQPYNFFALVRNGTHYGFSNLLLFFRTTFPDGSIRLDTVSCQLADPRGNWYGSGLGDMVDNEVLFKRNIQFPDTGKYVFEFQHAMRQDTLKEIYDIGLRIEEAN